MSHYRPTHSPNPSESYQPGLPSFPTPGFVPGPPQGYPAGPPGYPPAGGLAPRYDVPPPSGYPPANYPPPTQHQPYQSPQPYPSQSGPPPSNYTSAYPHAPPPAAGPLTFKWSPIKKTKEILNSTITDASGRKAFTITTSKSSSKDTIFSDKNGNVVAKVEWHEWLKDPTIDMKQVNNGKRIEIKKWIKSSEKKQYRRLTWNAGEFDWIEGPLNDYYLFHKDTRMHAIAHCHRANDIMELDLYPEALQAGLLEPSIVLAVLLLFPKAFGEPTEGEQAFIEGFAQGIGA